MQIQPISLPPAALRQLIRCADSHKGLYGSVAVLGGATGMVGATLLAGRAALYLGAGKVWLGLLNRNITVDPLQPELMILEAEILLASHKPTHLLIGPGLGQSKEALDLLALCLKSNTQLIIDADGLNLIASNNSLKLMLQKRQNETLITPHPTEAARLLKCTTPEVQNNRQQAITQLSKELNCTAILKGHESLIYCGGDIMFKNHTGNSALSSAGQGDVLGGIILALWAQGLELIDASCGGVYLHGRAADLWRNNYPNGVGLTASETIHWARTALNTALSIN
ncbi:NAD(P)H-hydrate dehydratase [Deefgea rivuli]|uniref:NAD(P)H-hydrate dehydratase n=1 Tax=Deefgea rivuli TaxID=400948 RepID=UPI0006861B49|nr:NAD(P)H-hydrate dehydratase [Deefgea rivuli]